MFVLASLLDRQLARAEHASRLLRAPHGLAMRARDGFVALQGAGPRAGDSEGHGGFLFDKLIFPLILRKVYADKNRQEAIVRESGLDWVLVRPSMLNDKPGRDSIRALTIFPTSTVEPYREKTSQGLFWTNCAPRPGCIVLR